MPLPTIADCFRVAIDYSESGSLHTATNVIHVLGPSMDEDDVFDLLNDSVTDSLWEPCGDGINVDQVVVTKLDGTPDGRVFGPSSLTGDWATSAASNDFAPQACALIKLATGATGRSGRGRIYLPWLADELVTRGILDGTTVTNTTAAWVTFTNALVTGGAALAVASYTNSTAAQVLNLACESLSATQRRRNRQ